MGCQHDPEAASDRHETVTSADAAGRDIFFAAIEFARMPMAVCDPHLDDNPIVFANAAFCDLSGYPPQELIGRNLRLLQGPGTDPATVTTIHAAMAGCHDVTVEILNYRKDGSRFWNAMHVSPVFGPGHELLYFFSSQLDVSDRRNAEAALRQTQKLDAVGQLSGGLAHDFNNLLTIVMGNIEVAMQTVDNPKVRRKLARAAQAADRAATLTHQMLAFGRKQYLQGQALGLNELVQDMGDDMIQTLGSAVHLRTVLTEHPWRCRADPAQARIAITNILLNAREAMPGGGEVSVETSNHHLAAHNDGASPGDYAMLSITDTGAGMAADILEHAVEPFFTTKEVGRGSGMGLAMVYGFMRQSMGYVLLTSQRGKGATVRLLFPVIPD